ncbi:MAG: hypothetical protein KJ964_10435 [Verrucomicrobia bacterium]|nr:hypothetical protein [Verrucomicrobiota bacterium]MBU1733632.1 hypothetical protein [Verrucomicrobiota bacterium]MBU1856943.1 hypothetical protein [Verrucomicrobiota bacterium]
MKTNNILLILAIFGSASFSNAQDKIHTTAKLPEDSIIWPLNETNTTIEIECTFLSETSLLRVTQGNWEKTEKLIIYDVTKVIRGSYSHKQIVFVCNERWPTKESGIMLKALVWPFRKGTKTFYLKKDGDCRTEDYFNITAYSK